MDVSRYEASRVDVAVSGRGAPDGGIAFVRSLRMTFSQVSALAEGRSTSRPANDRPPVLRRSLWQVRQYLLMVAAGEAAGCAGCAGCPAIASAATANNHGIGGYITLCPCASVASWRDLLPRCFSPPRLRLRRPA